MRKIGRTKKAIAEKLNINPIDIWQNCNVWVLRWGLARWGAGKYHSFDRMSDCVKYGFDICDNKEIVSKDIIER